jgi:hypothetical protein
MLVRKRAQLRANNDPPHRFPTFVDKRQRFVGHTVAALHQQQLVI